MLFILGGPAGISKNSVVTLTIGVVFGFVFAYTVLTNNISTGDNAYSARSDKSYFQSNSDDSRFK